MFALKVRFPWTMHKAALILICLPFVGHGRRVQQISRDTGVLLLTNLSPPESAIKESDVVACSHASTKAGHPLQHAGTRNKKHLLKALAAHFLQVGSTATYKTSGPAYHFRITKPKFSTSPETVLDRRNWIGSHVIGMRQQLRETDLTKKHEVEHTEQEWQATAASRLTAFLLSFMPAAVIAAAVGTNPDSTLSATDLTIVAQLLGYLVGAGSLLLYTPIILRVVRQDSADGLALSTWWLKLSAYTATDIYCLSRGYPLSAFVETAVISVEAAVLLFLVAWKQGRLVNSQFAAFLAAYLSVASWAILAPAPPEVLALGQASSALLSTTAVLPQLVLNSQRQDPGDYSPLTAGLACVGCLIRLFTTTQLADGDPILLAGFGLALVLNGGLLSQILYYGLIVQEMSLPALLGSDFTSTSSPNSKAPQDGQQ